MVTKRIRILLLRRMMSAHLVMILGEMIQMTVIVEKTLKKKEPSSSKPSSSKKRNKGDNDGKKPKKPKDPNTPKRAMSGFMFFSQLERENVKKDNPRISFKDIARVLGERWNKLTDF